VQPVVADHARDAQAVAREHPFPPHLLRAPVRAEAAPVADRLLVTPEGKRQELPRGRQALEPLHADEAVLLFEERAHLGRDGEVVVDAALRRFDFEDHGDHRRLLQ
jgi:hypothetical protein